MKRFAFVCGLLTLVCSGCGIEEEIDKVREDLKKELAETRKVVDGMSKAVPGERFMRIIEDLNSRDPDKVKDAQSFLRSLGHLEPEATYEVSVWFDTSPTTTVHADIFRATTNLEDAVDQYLKEGKYNSRPITNPLTAALTREQIQAEVRRRVKESIDAIVGNSGIHDGGISPQLYRRLSWDSPLTPIQEIPFTPFTTKPANDIINNSLNETVTHAMTRRKEVADKLADAVMLQFAEPLPLDTDKRLNGAWSPFDDKQVLIVLLQKKEWDKFVKDSTLRIRAVVHKKNAPAETLASSRMYSFALSEFTPRPQHVLFESPIPDDDQIVWAAHTMTDYSLFTPGTLEAMRETRRIRDEWDREARNEKAQPPERTVRDNLRSFVLGGSMLRIGVVVSLLIGVVSLFKGRNAGRAQPSGTTS